MTTGGLSSEAMKAALRAEVERALPPADELLVQLLEQAALVGHFDLDWLNERVGMTAAYRSAILNCSNPVDRELNRWCLRLAKREAMLSGLAQSPSRLHERVREAAPLPDDRAGQALQALLAEPETVNWQQNDSLACLEALFEATTWLQATNLPAPDPRMIRRRIMLMKMLRQLGQMGSRMVGRKAELDRLRELALGPKTASTPIAVMSLWGMGGVGKSALLARLVHDLASDVDEWDDKPFTFFLDYDRLAALGTDPLDYSIELARQLAFALPAFASELDRLRKDTRRARLAMAGTGGRADETSGLAEFRQQKELESSAFMRSDILGGLRSILTRANLRDRPLLMLFDTVEALQASSSGGVERLSHWLDDLHVDAGFRDLRVIVSGRVEMRLSCRHCSTVEPMRLGELEPGEAAGLLMRMGITRQLADESVAAFGGNPLLLRLAGKLILREQLQPGDLAEAAPERGRIDRELLQGMLYKQILGHVSDPRVRRIAHPGLAARRITPEVLAEVVGPACLGRRLEQAEAEDIYRSLALELWLVEHPRDGSAGLFQRIDLRRLTIRLLARDPVELARTIAVHRAAIDYYESGKGKSLPYARSEALYYRFMIPGGRMLPPLDPQVAKEARDAIGINLEELPAANLAALQLMLKDSVSEDALRLPADVWARHVASRGAGLMACDAFDEALALVELRRPQDMPPWLPGALDAMGRWDEMALLLSEQLPRGPADARITHVRFWLGAALKAGNRDQLVRAKVQAQRLLADPAAGAEASLASLVALLTKVIRASHFQGISAPAQAVVPPQFSAADLLRLPDLANEMASLAHVLGDRDIFFRPVQAHFRPSPEWLGQLIAVSGPVAGEALRALVKELSAEPPERLVSGRLLGHYSVQFEAAWTDALLTGRIPPEAFRMLRQLVNLPHFRAAARVAIRQAFPDTDALNRLYEAFVPGLDLVPADFHGPGRMQALANPVEAVTSLVAYADRSQTFMDLLRLSVELNPGAQGVRRILRALDHWLIPGEQAGPSVKAPSGR